MKLLTNDSAITTNDFYGHAEMVSAIIDTLPIPDCVAFVGLSAVYPVNCGSDVFDIIDGMDCKNGIDVFGINSGYVVRVYGSSVSYDGGENYETEHTDIVITSAR